MRTNARPSLLTRLAATSTIALLLGAALAGCGSSDKSDDSKDSAPKVKVLTKDEATSPLLIQANLGSGWTTDDSSDDEASDAPGCLSDISQLTKHSDAAVNVKADYKVADSETGLPAVGSSIQSFKSEAAAKKALDDLRAKLSTCTRVQERDTDGTVTDLTVTVGDDKTTPELDDQLDIAAVGTIAADQASEVGFWLALTRVDNNIAFIGVSALSKTAPGDITQLVKVIDDRLAAVVKGDKPDDTVVAGADSQ